MTSCTGATGQTGTVYTYAQLEGLWINAGGPKAVAPIAAAIAEAESGGCSAAVNPTDNNGTQTSWGLWQISNGTHAQPVANILSPSVNAGQAVAKYQGANSTFSPWGTYDSGAYKAYLNGSTTPDTNVPGSGTQATLTSYNSSTCVLGSNGLFGVGSFCLLQKSQARALIGGAIVGLSAAVGLVGAVILAAAAFQKTGALGKAADAAAVVPGAEGVAAGLAVAHSRATRTGQQAAASRRARRTGPGYETVSETRREPIESEMGGTRITRRTYRQPRNAS